MLGEEMLIFLKRLNVVGADIGMITVLNLNAEEERIAESKSKFSLV